MDNPILQRRQLLCKNAVDSIQKGEEINVLEEKDFISVKPETIVALVNDSGALDRARGLAHHYAHRAKDCIRDSDSEYARALLTLPDFILEREY